MSFIKIIDIDDDEIVVSDSLIDCVVKDNKGFFVGLAGKGKILISKQEYQRLLELLLNEQNTNKGLAESMFNDFVEANSPFKTKTNID